MQVFNSASRTLDYTDKNGNRYLLKLRGAITLVKSASGTGKTYLVQQLKAAKNADISNSIFENITLVDCERDLVDIFGAEDSLILIDHADKLLENRQDVVDYINGDMQGNTYIIFARGQTGIAYSPNYAAEFSRQGVEISVKYRYTVRGWF